MIIIEKTSVILPRFKRCKVADVAGGVSDYTCFAALGVVVTVLHDGKLFREAVRRYAKDDWSEHKQVRMAKKKARSKARAEERCFVAERQQRLQDMYEGERDKRFRAEALAGEHCKTIKALKIALRELQE